MRQYLILAVGLFFATSCVAVSASPSVTMAAHLAHIKTGWLAHYLPEDRYKIKGGVWKFVSTEYDDFYHSPRSSFMLRQPANKVIGFASAEDAKAAGYKPGPSVVATGMDFVQSSDPYLLRVESIMQDCMMQIMGGSPTITFSSTDGIREVVEMSNSAIRAISQAKKTISHLKVPRRYALAHRRLLAALTVASGDFGRLKRTFRTGNLSNFSLGHSGFFGLPRAMISFYVDTGQMGPGYREMFKQLDELLDSPLMRPGGRSRRTRTARRQ